MIVNDDPQSRARAKQARAPELNISTSLRRTILSIEGLDGKDVTDQISEKYDSETHGPGSLAYVVLLSVWTLAIILRLQ